MVALTVAGIIAGLIILDIVMSRAWLGMRMRRRRRAQGTGDRAASLDGALRHQVAPGVFHHRGHMWVHWQPGGEAVAGANDLLHQVVGPLDEVRAPVPGTALRQGEKAVMLRQGGKVMYLTAPVTGTVTEVNPETVQTPDLVKQDPYGRGWIFTMQTRRPEEDIHHMMLGDRAARWLDREARRMRFFLTERIKQGHANAADSGAMDVNGILERMNEETWILFKDQFIYQEEWRR